MTVLSDIVPGTCIGDRYRIETLLGQGGFGRTYLVSDLESLEALCVLKEFFPARTEGNIMQKSLELFQREAKVLQKLDHPQIPQFLNWFEDRGQICIIQEYIDGKTYWQLLKERLSIGQVFSEAEILQWLKDLLPVLDYLHRCNVIHRDISPDNIMLSRQSGKPILIDLGIVKEAVTHGYYSYVTSGGTLGSVSLVGKRGYSPPEQMLMGQCYPSSDLYSLAVTALVLLTGKSPTDLFDSHSMEWQWQNYVELSDDLQQIFKRMLLEKPKERYQSAKEFLATLPDSAPQHPSTPIITPSFASEEPTALLLSETTSESELDPPPQDKVSHSENNITRDRRKSLKKIGIVAAGTILSSIIVGFQSPFIPGLCKTLDNCARDKQYQTVYQQQVERGKEAITNADRAQSVEELNNARDRLNQSLTELKTIPGDVKISTLAQQTLQNYQDSIKQIDSKIKRGQQAEQQLKQAETLIAQATETTESAKTVAQFQQAKAQWDNVEKHLKTIPADVVIANKVKIQLDKSNTKATEISAKIQQQSRQLQAQQSRRQTTSRTSRPSSVRANRTRSTPTSQPKRVTTRRYNRPTSQRSRVTVPRSSSRSLWRNSPKRSTPSRSSGNSNGNGKKNLW
jgi:serine/threonine protein kinase/exonuclease VII small subunit